MRHEKSQSSRAEHDRIQRRREIGIKLNGTRQMGLSVVESIGFKSVEVPQPPVVMVPGVQPCRRLFTGLAHRAMSTAFELFPNCYRFEEELTEEDRN